MTEDELDTPLDFAGPGTVGCLGLGTAAVVVVDETVSIVDFLHNSCRFFRTRVLRSVHAMPRGYKLVAPNARAYPSRKG
jgi:NADH:ubiquinone oxidoreductase subunit F (NADH-binding)